MRIKCIALKLYLNEFSETYVLRFVKETTSGLFRFNWCCLSQTVRKNTITLSAMLKMYWNQKTPLPSRAHSSLSSGKVYNVETNKYMRRNYP